MDLRLSCVVRTARHGVFGAEPVRAAGEVPRHDPREAELHQVRYDRRLLSGDKHSELPGGAFGTEITAVLRDDGDSVGLRPQRDLHASCGLGGLGLAVHRSQGIPKQQSVATFVERLRERFYNINNKNSSGQMNNSQF